jgi:hypothetical protein
MTDFYFKRDSKVYLVYNDLKYDLDVFNFSANQTFDETPVRKRTLHDVYHRFDAAIIKKANPLNFGLTVPLLKSSDNAVLNNLLLGYTATGSLNYFDLYISNNGVIFKLEKCVADNGIYQIVRNEVLTLDISGSGSKLYKFTGAIPGTLQTKTNPPGYIIPTKLNVVKNSVVQTSIRALTLELRNNIAWLENKNVHTALNVTTSAQTIYPQNFTLTGRELTGTLQEYITSDNITDIQNWGTNETLTVEVGDLAEGYFLTFDLPQIVYTNRISIEDSLIKTYDIRLANSYISNLATVIQYH